MNIATREAYGEALKELASNENVVVLDADLAKATKSIEFKKVAPERFFDMGISELNGWNKRNRNYCNKGTNACNRS